MIPTLPLAGFFYYLCSPQINTMSVKISELLGAQADSLLGHTCKTISKEQLHLPGNDFVDRIFAPSNRNPQVMRSLNQLYNTGRKAGAGTMLNALVHGPNAHVAGTCQAAGVI